MSDGPLHAGTHLADPVVATTKMGTSTCMDDADELLDDLFSRVTVDGSDPEVVLRCGYDGNVAVAVDGEEFGAGMSLREALGNAIAGVGGQHHT